MKNKHTLSSVESRLDIEKDVEEDVEHGDGNDDYGDGVVVLDETRALFHVDELELFALARQQDEQEADEELQEERDEHERQHHQAHELHALHLAVHLHDVLDLVEVARDQCQVEEAGRVGLLSRVRVEYGAQVVEVDFADAVLLLAVFRLLAKHVVVVVVVHLKLDIFRVPLFEFHVYVHCSRRLGRFVVDNFDDALFLFLVLIFSIHFFNSSFQFFLSLLSLLYLIFCCEVFC